MYTNIEEESDPDYWSLRKLYLHWSSPSSDCQCSSWQTQQTAHLFPISAANACKKLSGSYCKTSLGTLKAI